jgi:tetratricopeptide (TPR) repeat protein
LTRDPSRADAFSELIRTEMLAGNAAAALDRCDRRLQEVGASSAAAAQVHNLKGAIYLTRRDYPAAETSFKAALACDPNYLKAYYELARIYLSGNRQDEAIAQCQSLLAKNPLQPSSHMLLGMLYETQNRTDMAETHYRRALEADAQFAAAANNLAWLLTERDINEALKFAQIAKGKLPDNPHVADTLGWIYYRKGLYDTALRELQYSAAQLPTNPEALYHLGMAYKAKEHPEEAKAALQKALALASEFNGADDARATLAGL